MRVKGASVEQAAHRIRAMRNTFEAAIVSAEAIAQLIPAMTNHEADRHVLAAAVASGADAVITANLRHFSPESCEPHGIDVIHPDEFLLTLFDLDPTTVHRAVIDQASALRRPPVSRDELIRMIDAAGAGHFARRLRGE
jgi:hypothetical protein